MRKFSIYGIFACIFALIFSCAEQKVATTPAKKGGVSPIVLPVPERAPGQTDVINLVTPKLETVRVGFVGLGMRGPGAVERFTQIPGTEIVALCDIEKNRVEKGQEILDKAGKKKSCRILWLYRGLQKNVRKR